MTWKVQFGFTIKFDQSKIAIKLVVTCCDKISMVLVVYTDTRTKLVKCGKLST